MTHDMLHVIEWHNGEKDHAPFSEAELARRQALMRNWMTQSDVDAVLFTAPPAIAYFSGWHHCAFGRRYGMVLTHEAATTISSGVDGGRGWRRSYGGNVTYTDWRRDNFYRAVRQLTAGVTRLGIEFDHVSLEFRRLLDAALPGVEMVDAGAAAMRMRTVKSEEELALIRKGAAIGDAGMRAAVACIAEGVPEYEVAGTATAAMQRLIAAAAPMVEFTDSWTWCQSGINTDGAHNPVTNRIVVRGDLLSVTCFPVLSGYLTALGRTLHLGEPTPATRRIWEQNVEVHRRGMELIRPGALCNEIAVELNGIYRDFGLLKHRTFGYGHSGGLVSPHHGREATVELREDVVTELLPGMVVSMTPMVMLPQGMPGAGGYREQDMLIVTETGAERLSSYPCGPDHNVL